MGVVYATTEQLAASWRPLTEQETARAEILLGWSSQKLRRALASRGVDVDASIASGALDELDAQMVVIEMVKRSLLPPTAADVTQQSQTAGPFSLSQSYANPQGNLYLTGAELDQLTPGPRYTARSVRLGP